jgi:type IX secretion system PorP/SprF family membrane protein
MLLGQDARFSQYFNNSLLLNPALAGNGIEFIRVTAIYRNQWSGAGIPFTTQGFAVDKKVNRVGLGGIITRNGAGDGGITTTTLLGNLSYNLPVGASGVNVFSGGLQVGIVNRSFDESKMKFDSQYDSETGYDPSLNSGEVFTSTSLTRPDINAGFTWQRGWLNKEIKFKPFIGIAFAHINKASESFTAIQNKTEIKKTFYTGAGYMLNEKTEVRPSVMLLRQAQFKETTFGSMINYRLDNKNSVQAGVYNRVNDAVIAYAGYQMNLLFVGMSYDINTSDLSGSGKGNNAFEISLTYSPKPRREKVPKEPVVKQRAEDAAYLPSLGIPANFIVIPDTLEHRNITTGINNKPETVIEILPDTTTVKNITATEVSSEIITADDFDNDGIADTIDNCPYIKGSATSNGCPDSDGDGVIDMADDCPMESGSVLTNGCPDTTIATSTTTTQTLIKKFDNILFATGSKGIRTDDIFDIIERAIDILYADKQSVVILSGHTDAEGDEYHNMLLSQARTEVVKKYMMRQGIDENRITTVAYGETMPLENNKTKDGKQLNRRVEINIIRKK